MAMTWGTKRGPANWKKLTTSIGIILLAGALWSDGGLHADEGGAFVMPGPDDASSAVDAMHIVDWDADRGLLQVRRPDGESINSIVVLTGVNCDSGASCGMLAGGEFDRLVDHFQTRAKAGRRDSLTRRGLALNLYLSGDLHGALRAYSWANGMMPEDPHVRVGMGAVLAELGLVEQARKELEPLLSRNDLSAPAWVGLGNAQKACGQTGEALKSYGKAARSAPDLGAAHFNHGLVLMDVEDPAQAAVAFRKSARHLSRFADAYLLEGLTRLRSEDSIGAAVALYRAEELGIRTAALNLALGVACRDQNLDDQAVKYLARAVKSGMKDSRIHQLLAASLMRLGRSQEAADALEEGFKQELKTADSHFLQGLKLFLVEQPERAAEHLLESVRMGKRDADVFFVLGQAMLQSGQAEGAIHSLQTAAKLKPASPEIHYSLGMALTRGEDHRGALREMRVAAALDPKDMGIARGLMEAYERVGEFGACTKLGRSLVGRRPELLSARFETAFCMALSGELDAAGAHLEAAMDQDLDGDAVHELWRKLQLMSDNDAEHRLTGVNFLLALIHQHRGKWSEATKAYERMIFGNPRAVRI